MKKIFAILTLFLAFSISANAQDSQKNPDTDATADLAKLTQFISLKENPKKALKFAFYDKNKALMQTTLSAQDKAQIKTTIENELATNLTAEQLEKLKANTRLYEELTN